MTDSVGAAVAIVHFSEAHVPTFTAWFNALPNNHVWTEDFVRSRTVDDPTYDPGLMLAATHDGAPVGFVLGNLANETGWIRAFIVHPNLRRQGIGSRLFEVAESAFRDRGVTDVNVGWAVPRYFLPGIDVAYTAAIVFLDRHGYETDRSTRINMDVELAGRNFGTAESESRLADLGVTIRRANAGDLDQITELCEANDSAMWALETGMALECDPAPIFIAIKNRRVCAFAAHSVCGPAHFGPMLTNTDLRGMGIGSVLLKRCLQDWQRVGLTTCDISWAGPISFYARTVGATMGRAFWAFHKSLDRDNA